MTKKGYSLLLLLFFPIFFINTLFAQEPDYFGKEPAKKLDWAIFYLDAHYVDTLDTERLAELAVIRMLKELDPFSTYQSKEQLDKQRKRDKGYKNDGLGFRYYTVNDTATVTYIDETGPAKKAGLLRGDKILSVDGRNTIGQHFKAIDDVLKAERGTIVAFNIYRKTTSKSLEIFITSKSLFAASLDAAYLIAPTIGFIRLNRFTTKTLGEVQTAIAALKKQGAVHLIIDLRRNRGGVVKGATNLADEFLGADKLIMHSQGKGYPKSEVFTTAAGSFESGKVVILTSGVTASASEIFTGALQEWDRALVIGEMTYGKGLIQQSYGLSDSSAVRLTIGRYYTPTGRTLQRPFKFDSSKDWVFQNIANAIQHKGFTSQLEIPDSVSWKTKSGRPILKGPGGIIPDIYLFKKTTKKPLLSKLNKMGVVYKFTVHHADKMRQIYLNRYQNSNEFRLDKKIERQIEQAFFNFLTAQVEDKNFAKSLAAVPLNNNIMTQIKAWLGPQIWENGVYYAVFNDEDEVVKRAIEVIQEDTFDRLGIEY